MIEIADGISIDEREVREDFIRASGPGGQNVNKLATAVQLRFDAAGSPSLSAHAAVLARLTSLAGARMTADGILIIRAQRFRTQEANRRDALERLVELLRRAAQKPGVRRRTRPTLGSKVRRLDAKRRRGETKRMRKVGGEGED